MNTIGTYALELIYFWRKYVHTTAIGEVFLTLFVSLGV